MWWWSRHASKNEYMYMYTVQSISSSVLICRNWQIEHFSDFSLSLSTAFITLKQNSVLLFGVQLVHEYTSNTKTISTGFGIGLNMHNCTSAMYTLSLEKIILKFASYISYNGNVNAIIVIGFDQSENFKIHTCRAYMTIVIANLFITGHTEVYSEKMSHS